MGRSTNTKMTKKEVECLERGYHLFEPFIDPNKCLERGYHLFEPFIDPNMGLFTKCSHCGYKLDLEEDEQMTLIHDLIADALEAVHSFEGMSLDEWMNLHKGRRGFIVGCIFGAYTNNHPKEAYELLKNIYQEAKAACDKAKQ